MSDFNYLLGRRLTNYVKGGASFSDSTSLHKIEVPAGKRWFVLGGMVSRDQAATLSVSANDAAGNKLLQIAYGAAATTGWAIPNNTADSLHLRNFPLVLEAGETINFSFGAAQSTNAIITMFITEVDV